MARVGPYELLSVLGQGGMGTVHRARHVELGAVRALKLLLVRRGGTPADAGRVEARFAREAQVLATIRHPNVVGIHDSGVHEGAPWFAMDLVEGEPLDKVLERGPLPFERGVALMIDVCRGVDALHEAGVVHRDLKPANIIVTPSGRPVVIDLGLAIAPDRDDRLTRTGTMVGTPSYMAPEQIEGRHVSARTDVHALGLITYEVLTAVLAIGEGSTSVHQVMGAVMTGDRPVPSDKVPDLPVALDRVCARAMARQPDDRYERAGELADALEAVKANPGHSRRHHTARLRALLVATLVVLAAAVVTGVVVARKIQGEGVAAATSATTATTPSAAPTAAPPRDDLATRELEAVKRQRAPERRRELAEAWLARHGSHPLASEAQAIARDAVRAAPLASLEHLATGLTIGCFASDTRVVSGGADGTVRVWTRDARSWQEEGRWAQGGPVLTLTRLPDRSRAHLSVRGGWVRRLKLDDEEDLKDGPQGLVLIEDLTALGGNPAGTILTAAQERPVKGSYSVRLINITEKHANDHVAALRSPIRAVALTAAGVVVTASGAPFGDGVEHALVAWDLRTGAERWRAAMFTEVSCLALSPDEQLVAAGMSSGQLVVLQVALGPAGAQADLKGAGATRTQGGITNHGAHLGGVKALAFSPDGARLYSVSDRGKDAPGGELRVWSLAERREARPAVACPLPGTTLDVSPDGKALLLSTRQGRVEVWTAE